MEVFNSLMSIFLMLIGINLILLLSLWRATGSKLFISLILHWFFLLIGFYVHISVGGFNPFHIAIAVLIPDFLIQITLVSSYRDLSGVPFRNKNIFFYPLFTFSFTLLAKLLEVPDAYLSLPIIVFHSFLYFHAVYDAYSNKEKEMSFAVKAISVLMVLSGLHLYDYIYFSSRLDLLAIGFAVAMAFEMAIAVLFPAAIIEKMSIENERLKSEMEFNSKISYAAKMASLGEMAGGVAHELNNPLTILNLYHKKIKKLTNADNPSLPLINKCISTVDRMDKIIKSMLVFSREDNSSEFTQVVVDDLIDDTLGLCAEKFKSHQIDLILDLPDKTLNFIGNSVQLSQVLLNLLNNSYDAIEEMEDEVDEVIENKWIKISVKELKEHLEFSVVDSGKGLDDITRQKMFNPFFTTKAIGKGTGLGLSISKGILENHKGAIFYDPTSKNTKIVFVIPKFQFVSNK